jgi:hypothetical protein
MLTLLLTAGETLRRLLSLELPPLLALFGILIITYVPVSACEARDALKLVHLA